MMLVDADHRYVMLEGVPFERSGVAPESVIGRTISEVITDERRDALIAHVDRALAGESGAFDIAGPVTQTVYRVHYAPYIEHGEITHAALDAARRRGRARAAALGRGPAPLPVGGARAAR